MPRQLARPSADSTACQRKLSGNQGRSRLRSNSFRANSRLPWAAETWLPLTQRLAPWEPRQRSPMVSCCLGKSRSRDQGAVRDQRLSGVFTLRSERVPRQRSPRRLPFRLRSAATGSPFMVKVSPWRSRSPLRFRAILESTVVPCTRLATVRASSPAGLSPTRALPLMAVFLNTVPA
ncbi:hypothetical protein D3C80_895850 [compost metagenome]